MKEIRIGLFTDVHYADIPMKINRYYDRSLNKISKYISFFREQQVDYIIHLGDLIEDTGSKIKNKESLKKAFDSLQEYKKKSYFLLGNHDTSALSLQNLSQYFNFSPECPYYSFDLEKTHFIFLDSNYDKNGCHFHTENVEWDNTYINQEQLDWLKRDVDSIVNKKIIVFSHALLDNLDDPHVIRNAEKVRCILENTNKEILVIQGHKHSGNYSFFKNITYHTIRATVEGHSSFCCWVISIFDKNISAKIFSDKGLRYIDNLYCLQD